MENIIDFLLDILTIVSLIGVIIYIYIYSCYNYTRYLFSKKYSV